MRTCNVIRSLSRYPAFCAPSNDPMVSDGPTREVRGKMVDGWPGLVVVAWAEIVWRLS